MRRAAQYTQIFSRSGTSSRYPMILQKKVPRREREGLMGKFEGKPTDTTVPPSRQVYVCSCVFTNRNSHAHQVTGFCPRTRASHGIITAPT
jgi:hypothetical protein